MALQVLRQLLQHYPSASLCMVGPDKDGSLARAKSVASNFGISDKVTFTGKLEKEAWHQLAADYDIFLNTTTVDNTPISIIESLALGLPIVSTNVGGVPYLVSDGESALLVASADADSMAKSVIRLVETPSLAEHMSTQGHKLALQFDWQQVRNKWVNLINSVVIK